MSEVKEHLKKVGDFTHEALKELALITENHCNSDPNFAPARQIENALNVVLRKVEAANGMAEIFESNPEHGRF